MKRNKGVNRMKIPKLTQPFQQYFTTCKALNDDEHWAVYIFLMHHPLLCLTEISNEFDSTYHEIKPILEDLIRGGLVEQFILKPDDAGDLDKRYYRITIYGYAFYYNLFDCLFPRKRYFKRENRK